MILKDLKLKNVTYQRHDIINEKNIYDQAIDSDIKWYEEMRKLTAGQGEVIQLDVYEIMIISKIIIDY